MQAEISESQLQRQCDSYAALFDIAPETCIRESYSDLLLNLTT
jgi:adenylate cyclase class IV